MFKKIVDVLKEVFWLKKSPKRSARKPVRKKIKALPKKTVKAIKPVKKAQPSPKVKSSIVKPVAPAKEKKIKTPQIDPALKPMGEITHYFDRIKVAVLKINQGTVLINDRLTIISGKTKFVQKVWSMQIESEDVKVAKKGQIVGIKVDRQVVPGDIVYK